MSDKKEKVKIKRGRTGSDLPPAMKNAQKGLVSGSRSESAHSAGRPERIPMHKSKTSNLPEHMMEDGFYYRDFLDRPGRIEKALQAGYDFVVDEQGNKYTYPSGGQKHVTMKLPMKYREEDLKAKAENAARVRRTEIDSANQLKSGEYIPDGRGKALQSD